jgi:hypothetical protein
MKEDLNELQKTIQEAIDKFLNKWFQCSGFVPAKIDIEVNHQYLTTYCNDNIEKHGRLVQNTAEVSLTIKS